MPTFWKPADWPLTDVPRSQTPVWERVSLKLRLFLGGPGHDAVSPATKRSFAEGRSQTGVWEREKMTMLTQISQSEFNDTDPAFRVITHDHARRFGRLQLRRDSRPLVLSWRSDLIEPTLVRDEKLQVAWIGVDQRLACVALDSRTLFSVGLASPILQIKHLGEFIVALCETELLVINRDYSLRCICNFPEIADTVDMRDGKVVGTFLDGDDRICAI